MQSAGALHWPCRLQSTAPTGQELNFIVGATFMSNQSEKLSVPSNLVEQLKSIASISAKVAGPQLPPPTPQPERADSE